MYICIHMHLTCLCSIIVGPRPKCRHCSSKQALLVNGHQFWKFRQCGPWHQLARVGAINDERRSIWVPKNPWRVGVNVTVHPTWLTRGLLVEKTRALTGDLYRTWLQKTANIYIPGWTAMPMPRSWQRPRTQQPILKCGISPPNAPQYHFACVRNGWGSHIHIISHRHIVHAYIYISLQDTPRTEHRVLRADWQKKSLNIPIEHVASWPFDASNNMADVMCHGQSQQTSESLSYSFLILPTDVVIALLIQTLMIDHKLTAYYQISPTTGCRPIELADCKVPIFLW